MVTDLWTPYGVEKETRMEPGSAIKLSGIQRTGFLSCIVGEILSNVMVRTNGSLQKLTPFIPCVSPSHQKLPTNHIAPNCVM